MFFMAFHTNKRKAETDLTLSHLLDEHQNLKPDVMKTETPASVSITKISNR